MGKTKDRARRRPGGQARRKYRDLAHYIAATGDTQAQIAAKLNVTQAYVSRVAGGLVIPRAVLAVKIAEYAKIPLDSFTRAYLKRQALEAETQPAA